MAALRLHYPVHTIDNRELLPAGPMLSQEALDSLIPDVHDAPSPSLGLLKYGSVKDDLLHFFEQTPYRAIFSDKKRTAAVTELMQRVRLALPVLQSLDYFKQYDFYTYRHILMVLAMSMLLAQDLVEDHQNLIQEAATGPSHDFGKICVPLKTLRKTEPLTLTERKILEHLAVAGYVLLSYYLRDIGNLAGRVARDHHEKKDGSGYAIGLCLTDPMVEIVVASDVYDALISTMPYRPTSYDNRTTRPHFSDCEVSIEKRGTPLTASTELLRLRAILCLMADSIDEDSVFALPYPPLPD